MEAERDDSADATKFGMKLKSRPRDGVVLQLHHTVREPGGESRRIRFTCAAWDGGAERLAAADTAGNVFVLDLAELKFWKLAGAGAVSALYFVPGGELLAAASAARLLVELVHVGSGRRARSLEGHSAPVRHLHAAGQRLLSASPREAILWELPHCAKYFTLSTYLGAHIQQILFSPPGDLLVACFQNDTIQVWKRDTMKSVKQIIPSELKHLKSVAFTANGRAMAIAGLAPALILFSLDTWKALRSVDLTRYGLSGTQQVAFVPQTFDGGANRVLAALGSDRQLYLLDVDSLSLLCTVNPEPSGIRRFAVGPSGKYLVCVLQQGQVNIYKSALVVESARAAPPADERAAAGSSADKCCLRDRSESKAAVEARMRVCMDGARLRRILLQYGEYPERFRAVIWRSLLATPRNRPAYAALLDRGVHPAFRDLDRRFTIHSAATLRSLRCLLSCLAHWCPLFAVTRFLPAFVFPFVKVLQKDPLLLFEAAATVLLNQCQLWFEYAPFPPLSVLAMVENVLAARERALLDHFVALGATAQLYALPVLETAFSEVLAAADWLLLWDHVLSNEPAFLLMAVVAYSVVQRTALRKLDSRDRLEAFFHRQNPIDKKAFLKKAYALLEDTPEDVHPRKFFAPFAPLEKGECYRQFTGYPKATICLKLAKQNRKKILKSERRDLTAASRDKEASERLLNTADLTDAGSARSDDSGRRAHDDSGQRAHDDSGRRAHDAAAQGDHCARRAAARASRSKTRRPPAGAGAGVGAGAARDTARALEEEVERLMSPCAHSDSD